MPGCWETTLLALVLAGSMQAEPVAGSQAPAPAPTLAETADWIRAHLVGLTHARRQTVVSYLAKKGKPPKEVDRQVVNTRESVSAASFDGCSLTLGQLTRGDDYTVVLLSTIPLDRLTRAEVKVDKFDPVKTSDGLSSTESSTVPASVTVLELEADMNVIAWRRRDTGSPPTEEMVLPYEGRSNSVSIRIDDEQMPPRLVNAFNHAIGLCHADTKPEPF